MILESVMRDGRPALRYAPREGFPQGISCADWRFLLPRLRFESILCLGAPPEETLRALRGMSQQLVVAAFSSGDNGEVHREAETEASSRFQSVFLGAEATLPLPEGAFDLVWIARSHGSPTPARQPRVLAEVARVLKPAGSVYFEFCGLLDRALERRTLRTMSTLGLEPHRVFWLAPLRGEVRTAVPLDEPAIARHVFENILHGQSPKGRWLSRAARFANRAGMLNVMTPRHGVLARRAPGNGSTHSLPDYLLSVAAEAGVDLSGFRYGFSARGIYQTNKVVFHLFPPQSDRAGIIIRMARHPGINYRLENEYRALTLVRDRKLVDPSTVPAPLFLAHHEECAILAQVAVRGRPVRQAGLAKIDSEIVRRATDWLTSLATASAQHSADWPETVSATMLDLLHACGEVYGFSEEQLQFLQRQIDALAGFGSRLPFVFQHGDTALDNLLVSERGELIFVDWEFALPCGVPLWDFFQFFKSLALWFHRMDGNRDILRGFARYILEGSSLNRVMAETTERYCGILKLDPRCVEPLFYTYLLHRAVEDSCRLAPAELQGGEFINLLRSSIAGRNAPGLRRLFQG